jgi:hypothetical protein
MPEINAFEKWLEQFTYLSPAETANLPNWQRPLAFVHQFAMDAMGDGVGSLFYNHPENVDSVAEALDTIGEPELARKIRVISGELEPFVAGSPPNWQEILVEQCLEGAASRNLGELDSLLNQGWNALYDKLEASARSNGWRP